MSTALWRALLVVFLFVGTCAAASLAHAQEEDKARAIQLIDEANAAYDSGEFRNALRLYREVYRLTADPRVLYRIALNFESLGNYQRAREHFELFLLAEPDTKYAGRVKAKIQNLRELESTLQAAVRIETFPSGADVWIDDEEGPPVGVTPVRIPVGAGTHEVLIRKAGFATVRDEITAEPSQTVQKSYELSGTGEDAPPEATPEPTGEASVAAVASASPTEHFTGQPTRVILRPSATVAAVLWAAVGMGWVAGTVGVILGQATANPKLSSLSLAVGVGLAGLGGYFLWFHDWSRHLPSATAGTYSPAPARGLGLRVPF